MSLDIAWFVLFHIVLVLLLAVYFFRPERIRSWFGYWFALGLLAFTFLLQIAIPHLIEQWVGLFHEPTIEQTVRRVRFCGGAAILANYLLVLWSLYAGMASLHRKSNLAIRESSTT